MLETKSRTYGFCLLGNISTIELNLQSLLRGFLHNALQWETDSNYTASVSLLFHYTFAYQQLLWPLSILITCT